jgi:hypothetical protein
MYICLPNRSWDGTHEAVVGSVKVGQCWQVVQVHAECAGEDVAGNVEALKAAE